MTTSVQLAQRAWVLGEEIGSGGFGSVRLAKSDLGEAVAKLIPKEPGAERELLFADLQDVRNVVPVIDNGETETHWVLVMPRAEMSLREHLDKAAGPLDAGPAVVILTDIAETLTDLDGQVVHRDLKPENVLLLDGRWCLADFGISRYAEASTAPDTKKYALSPVYAAPERWRTERAQIATDVYSLGIIAYELLAGSPPFDGGDMPTLREQHLHDEPPTLRGVPLRLAALVDECLYKAPGARPAPANLLARLAKVVEVPTSAGLANLMNANQAEVARRGEGSRRESQAQTDADRRADLLKAASRSFTRIVNALKEAIVDVAPSVASSPDGSSIRLNEAEIVWTGPTPTPRAPWGDWEPPAFEVIAHGQIRVRFPANHYEGRSHSLWFCDSQEVGSYKWFETAFMVSALIPQQPRMDPFALDPSMESAKALWNGMAEYQVAWPFTPLEITDLEDYIDRWAGWFAAAAQRQLHHPSVMPERSPDKSWRRN